MKGSRRDFLRVAGVTALGGAGLRADRLHRDAPQSRAHLAFVFWPDSTEAQARGNLRTLLHRLRHALPGDATFLGVDAQTVQWHPEAPATVDLINFEDALAQAQDADETAARQALEQAAEVYSGDLLPSCYDDWILPHRERLRQAHLRALERLIQLLEDRRECDAAIVHAQRILRLDPLHEAATRRLMHLRALKGDRAGALGRFTRAAARVLGDDGELVMRTRILRQFTIGSQRHKLVAEIDIEDNGPGIPEALRETLFLPMVSGSADGAGLGLSIAQSLVARHGGLIEFESEPGRTVFKVYLPLE